MPCKKEPIFAKSKVKERKDFSVGLALHRVGWTYRLVRNYRSSAL